MSAAAFAIVPVPILLFVAIVTLLVGTDHPNGRWADRHRMNTSIRRATVQNSAARLSDDMETGKPLEDTSSKDEKGDNAVDVDVAEVVPSGRCDPGIRRMWR